MKTNNVSQEILNKIYNTVKVILNKYPSTIYDSRTKNIFITEYSGSRELYIYIEKDSNFLLIPKNNYVYFPDDEERKYLENSTPVNKKKNPTIEERFKILSIKEIIENKDWIYKTIREINDTAKKIHEEYLIGLEELNFDDITN